MTFVNFPPKPLVFRKKIVIPEDNFNIFLASPYLLKPLVEPKELGRMDGIIILINPESTNPYAEILPYLEKTVLALQTLVPTHLYAYFSRNSTQTDEIFFKMIEFRNILRSLFDVSVDIMHLHEGINSKFFAGILSKFRRAMIKTPSKIKIPRLKIQNLLSELKRRMQQIERKTYALEDKLALLMELEKKIGKPLTKRFLIQRYGLQRHFTISLLNSWEMEYPLAKSSKSSTLDEALAMYQKVLNSRLDPNFVNFAGLGYRPTQIQQYVPLLKQNKTLEPRLCAFHIPHKAYSDYLNLKEFILLQQEHPIWNHRPAGSDEDKIVLFSALIQAIELLRNDFFQRFEDIEPVPREDMEILEFGPLKAVIGESKGHLKLIIRLRKSPSNQLKQRIRKFLGTIDAVIANSNVMTQKNYGQLCDNIQRLFSEIFNPYPIYVRVHERYQLCNYYSPDKLTALEKHIIEKIKPVSDQSLFEMMRKIIADEMVGESDIITTIIELIRQRILKIEH